eukprot:scaffold14657_cov146-Isochrysis_galbana.AAC.1
MPRARSITPPQRLLLRRMRCTGPRCVWRRPAGARAALRPRPRGLARDCSMPRACSLGRSKTAPDPAPTSAPIQLAKYRNAHARAVESKVVHELNKPRRDEPAACTVATPLTL